MDCLGGNAEKWLVIYRMVDSEDLGYDSYF